MSKTIDDYKKDFDDARRAGDWKGMQNANDAANRIRNANGEPAQLALEDIASVRRQSENGGGGGSGGGGSYGGSGGGSSGGSSGGYTPPAAPDAYASPYSAQIDALLQDILHRDPFSYNQEEDPLYQQYEKTYTRNGKRAMEDTLGQVSARTGGLASSYAATASQQAYDQYMQALNDRVPELYQAAYEKYMHELNGKRQDLGLLQQLDQGQYGRYRDRVGDFQTNRAFDYGVYSDNWSRGHALGREAVEDSRYEQQWRHGLDREAVEDQRYQDQTAYDRAQDQYQKDAGRAALLAAAGDFSGYAGLWGLTPEQTETLVGEYARQRQTSDAQAARDLADWYARYGDFSKLRDQGVDTAFLETQQRQDLTPSGGGGYSGGGQEAGQDYDALFQAALDSGHPKSFLANNYKQFGFSSASGLYDDFTQWQEEGGGMEPVTSYAQLGPEGKRLAGGMAQADAGQHAAYYADLIEAALDKGTITPPEADYLLKAIGY